MRTAYLVLTLLGAAGVGLAERPSPAKWTLEMQHPTAPPGSQVTAGLQAHIDGGWHLYSPTTPKGGPIPTTIRLPENVVVAHSRVFEPEPKRAFDPNFNLDTETYEGDPAFLIEVDLKKDAAGGPCAITAEVRYQMCNDHLCLPPVKRAVTATLVVDASAKVAAFAAPAGYIEAKPSAVATTTSPGAAAAGDSQGLALFLAAAFGFGLAAIFTPCVFPMIPITMSYFLNRPSGTRRDSVTQAAIFCIGIIVLFSGLGLLATALLGPFGIVQLGSNPWVNGFIALV